MLSLPREHGICIDRRGNSARLGEEIAEKEAPDEPLADLIHGDGTALGRRADHLGRARQSDLRFFHAALA
jgi:hypothetical protein